MSHSDNPSESEQKSWVERCKAGDAAAFECLVRVHQERVFRLIQRIVGVDADVEDLAQEIFLKAYQELPRFREACAFSTWLTRKLWPCD